MEDDFSLSVLALDASGAVDQAAGGVAALTPPDQAESTYAAVTEGSLSSPSPPTPPAPTVLVFPPPPVAQWIPPSGGIGDPVSRVTNDIILVKPEPPSVFYAEQADQFNGVQQGLRPPEVALAAVSEQSDKTVPDQTSDQPPQVAAARQNSGQVAAGVAILGTLAAIFF